jgi:hypothetical protein
MANPQIDQFAQALMWKAVPPMVLLSIAGILLKEGLRWLERKAVGAGRARRKAGETKKPESAMLSGAHPKAASPPPLPVLAPTTLESLSWENFELVAAEIFRRKGFEVEICAGLGADGGKDLTLRRNGQLRLVQCKCLSAGNKVSVATMRDFYGLVVAEKAQGGIFMTTGLFSRDAREFAQAKPIKLLERQQIEKLMASVIRPGENLCDVRTWIDDFAAVARVTDPACPRCRKPMKLRRGPTGRAFWSCCRFPRCRGNRDARTDLVEAFSYQ